ncbi:MAG TPA: hypothetical protein VIM75_06735 [Ohtaekwangia sp.]
MQDHFCHASRYIVYTAIAGYSVLVYKKSVELNSKVTSAQEINSHFAKTFIPPVSEWSNIEQRHFHIIKLYDATLDKCVRRWLCHIAIGLG